MITLKNITDGLRMATKYRYNQMSEPTNRENKKVLEDAALKIYAPHCPTSQDKVWNQV